MGRLPTFVLAIAAAAVAAPLVRAAAPVEVRQDIWPVCFTEYELTHETKPSANSANFPARGGRRGERPLDLATVELENRYLWLAIVPEAGGPVARAFYKPARADLFHVSHTASNGVVAWTSGVKGSFPYKEHGIRLPDQPASWRVVRGEDGSATVALWMEFSRFDGPWNTRMFGRFSNMLFSQHVTLRPDDAAFSVTYRMVNPAPYRQGRQLWNDALFPRHHTRAGGVIHEAAGAPARTATEWVFPAAHASGHSGGKFRPYDPDATMAALGKGDSVFGWAMKHPFAGLYYPEVRVNRLRITEPAKAPGAKQFYTEEARPAAAVELWTGTDSIFEEVEDWIEPGEAFQFTLRYVLLAGIGKVDYANAEAAVHVDLAAKKTPGIIFAPCVPPAQEAGPVLEAVTYRPVERLVVRLDGKALGEAAPCGPETPARFDLPRGLKQARIALVADGRTVLDQAFPVVPEADEAKYEVIRRALDPNRPENHEKMGNSESMGRAVHRAEHPAGTTGRGRVLYRLGRLDAAIATLIQATAADPQDGEAWHLLGAAMLEKGLTAAARAAFGKAIAAARPYPPARHFLAIGALAEPKRAKEAAEHLVTLVKERPSHWEARLLLALVEARSAATRGAGLARARALVEEDPADPRAAYVLWRALEGAQAGAVRPAGGSPPLPSPGTPASPAPQTVGEAQAAFDALMKEPGAARRLEEFQAAAEGRYKPPRRILDLAAWKAAHPEAASPP